MQLFLCRICSYYARKVYAKFTQSVRNFDAKFTQSLRNSITQLFYAIPLRSLRERVMENLRRNSSPLRNHDGQLADGRAEIEIYRRVVSFLGAFESKNGFGIARGPG